MYYYYYKHTSADSPSFLLDTIHSQLTAQLTPPQAPIGKYHSWRLI